MSTMHQRLRLALATLVAIAASAGGTLLAASPAQAATTLVECETVTQMYFTPGVTLVPRHFSASGGGTIGLCLGNTEVSSGTFTITGSAFGGCLIPNLAITITVTWDDASTSVVPLTPIASGFLIEYIGTVTSGRFAGATVEFAAVGLPTLTGTCQPDSPLTGANGVGTIAFISLL